MECSARHDAERTHARSRHCPLGLDAQKKTLAATERNEQHRQQWREQVSTRTADQFVVIDECGSNLNMTPRYARAPKGQRAVGHVPRNTPKNTTLIAALTVQGMGPAMVLEGATDTAAFLVYIEHFLAPALRPGQVVVLDNLSAHQHQRVRDVIEARGCELWYLPAYSPDLSPIEEAFAKLKHLLRHAAARTRDALIDAIAAALARITTTDARHFFQHCGYHTTAKLDQPL